jgi:hypothetical protein
MGGELSPIYHEHPLLHVSRLSHSFHLNRSTDGGVGASEKLWFQTKVVGFANKEPSVRVGTIMSGVFEQVRRTCVSENLGLRLVLVSTLSIHYPSGPA